MPALPSLVYFVGVPVIFLFTTVNTMAGLGTAFIVVPMLYWLGVPLREAAPTGLLLNFLSLSLASVTYVRGGLVDIKSAAPIAVAAIVLAPLGARASRAVDQSILLWGFSAFLVFAGLMMLFYQPRPHAAGRGAPAVAASGVLGAFAGFVGGLLGVGGGNIILPFLTRLGFDAKVAAATTALIVALSSLAGFFGHVALGGVGAAFLGVMALTALGGALLGSHLMRFRVSTPQLKRIMAVILFLAAAEIIQRLLT